MPNIRNTVATSDFSAATSDEGSPDQAIIKSRLFAILFVLFLFLVAQGFLFIVHSAPLDRGETDGIEYMRRSMGDFFQYDPYQGIGYPWAIRFLSLTGLHPFESAKIVSILSGMVLVAVTYFVSLRFVSHGYALIAVIFAAFNVNTMVSSAIVASDMLAAALFVSSIGITLYPGEKRSWHFVLAGAFSGYAYLTRYVYIFMLVYPLIFLLVYTNRRKYLWMTGVFLAGFFIVTSPWMTFLQINYGNPIHNSNHDNLILKYMIQLGYPDERGVYSGFTEIVFTHPLIFVESITKSLLLLPQNIFGSISSVGILGILGAVIWLPKLNQRKLIILFPCLIYAGLTLLVTDTEIRYRLPLVPLVSLLVAVAIGYIPKHFSSEGLPQNFSSLLNKVPLRSPILVLAIGFTLGFSVWTLTFDFSGIAPEYVEAGKQLSDIANEDETLLAWRPHIGLWANLKYERADQPTIEDLLAYLETNPFDYVAVDERYAASYYPDLQVLLDPDNPYKEELTPVLVIDSPKKVVIYEYHE